MRVDAEEHYVTAMAMDEAVVVMACRCGAVTRASIRRPQEAWVEHLTMVGWGE